MPEPHLPCLSVGRRIKMKFGARWRPNVRSPREFRNGLSLLSIVRVSSSFSPAAETRQRGAAKFLC